ncbi:MAG: helix-turn-helix domain-containing protein [Rhodospirillaceae bacterium]|nr:MAG: helix-turn-helix domain-containing protein [Rhodospirillaceae bacterium]
MSADRNVAKIIPISSFSTQEMPAASRFEAWRESMAPLLDVAPATEGAAGAFFGEFESYLVGPLVMGGTTYDAHRYGRSPERIARDGLNHYHLNLHLAGGVWIRVGDREFVVGPNDITLFDFAKPFEGRSEKSSLLVVAIPRDALEALLPPGSRHGVVLRGNTGLGALLGDFMKSLAVRLPNMTMEEASAAAAGSITLIAACFRPSMAVFNQTAGATSTETQREQIRHYIDNNLHQPLTIKDICKAFGVSRPSLYRMFAPYGGVARYVRDQKLSRAFTRLMNPLERHRRIAEIGFEAGYQSEAPFSRAFRMAFGLSPKDVRVIASTEKDFYAKSPINAAYRQWLTHLRRK